jgi:hypothetical protein
MYRILARAILRAIINAKIIKFDFVKCIISCRKILFVVQNIRVESFWEALAQHQHTPAKESITTSDDIEGSDGKNTETSPWMPADVTTSLQQYLMYVWFYGNMI